MRAGRKVALERHKGGGAKNGDCDSMSAVLVSLEGYDEGSMAWSQGGMCRTNDTGNQVCPWHAAKRRFEN